MKTGALVAALLVYVGFCPHFKFGIKTVSGITKKFKLMKYCENVNDEQEVRLHSEETLKLP